MPKTPLALVTLLLCAFTLNAAEFSRDLERVCNTVFSSWTISADGETSRHLDAAAGQSFDLRESAALSVVALRTDHTTGGLRLRWILHSRTGGVYQAAQAMAVSNAAPNVVSVSLLPASAALVPMGHQRPWDDLAAAEIVRIELRAECSFNASREALSVALSQTAVAPRKAATSVPELTGLRVLPAPSSSRADAQLIFRLNPLPADPFAVDGEGDLRIHYPDGSQSLAFIDQDFILRDDGSAVCAVPVGAPYFRAPLTKLPAQGVLKISSGPHVWNIEASALKALQESAAPSVLSNTTPGRWQPPLTASIPAETPHGLPRVCSLLNPKGHFESLTRTAPTDACWRPVPFWTSDWGGFSGTLQPNLELAARMDAALNAAAAHGEIHPLLLFDGTTLGRTGPFNWLSNPARNALKGPGELYRTEAGERFAWRWMRYALARWGASKSVDELWVGLEALAPGDAAFFSRLAPKLHEWSQGTTAPIFGLHPFASETGSLRTLATFDGNDPVNWFADIRQGKSVGARVGAGSDGDTAFELRARNLTEMTIGLTSDYFHTRVLWNQIPPDNFASGDTLLFDVLIPADAPLDLRLGMHLRDRDGLWYQALLPIMPNPGDWTTLALDLSARNAHGLTPVDHAKPWTDYSRQRLIEMGLHLYTTHANWTPANGVAQPLSVQVDHIRLAQRPAVALPPMEMKMLAQRVLRKGAVMDANDAAPGDLYECDVALNRTFENPFDPTQCDLSGVIKLPSGKTVRVPLFFNQPCERSEASVGGDEIVQPLGKEYFTLRYRILEAGAYSVSLELRDGGRYDVRRKFATDTRYTPDGRAQAATGRARRGETEYPDRFENGKRPVETVRFEPGAVSLKLDLKAPAFTARPTEKPFRGFVRVAGDQRHFEFDDGSFYYALGPCVRSPSDTRIAYLSEKWSPQEIARLGRRGTYQYDDYFAEYEKAGINWARVWMCPWWCALEWRRDWPGYQGVGRYNLLNAWRLDHVLAEAEKRGVYISLCLTNHGQYSLQVDSEWGDNPYNARLGGPLIAASEFFSRGDAKILHENKLRYILARFGHSPAIASWALFSELEWTEEFEPDRWNDSDSAAPIINAWHTEMATFLHENDPNRHLVLTHFSHPNVGESTLALPAVDIAASNAYSAFEEFGQGRFDAGYALSCYWAGLPEANLRGFAHFKKPALVEEQGRHWMGGKNNTESQLRADLHAELWGSMVQPLAGATGYWWWVQLHVDKWYDEYAALSRFMKNEDFRPSPGETLLEPAFRRVPSPDGELHGRALKSNRRLYAWVFNPLTPRGGDPRAMRDGEIRIGGLEPGPYTLEFWDTERGEKIEERAVTVVLEGGKPQSLLFKLPPVKKDLALKLKPKK